MKGASRWLDAKAPPPAGRVASRARAAAVRFLSLGRIAVSFRCGYTVPMPPLRRGSRRSGAREAREAKSWKASFAAGAGELCSPQPIAGGAEPSQGSALEAGELCSPQPIAGGAEPSQGSDVQ